RAARLPPRALPRRRSARRRGAGDAAPASRRRSTHGACRCAGAGRGRDQRPPAQHRRHARGDLLRARTAGNAGACDLRRRAPGRLAGARAGTAGRGPPDPAARPVQRRASGDAARRGGVSGPRPAAPCGGERCRAATRVACRARRRTVTATSRFSRSPPCCPAAGLHLPLVAPMTDAPNDTIAVRFDAVRLDRGGRTILSGIDLSVPRGSVTAVLGPSGCGKSTLLAALTGELVPAAGRVEVFG